MKPHHQAAPGLGRLSDKLGSLAGQYRKRIEKEMATHSKRRGPDADD